MGMTSPRALPMNASSDHTAISAPDATGSHRSRAARQFDLFYAAQADVTDFGGTLRADTSFSSGPFGAYTIDPDIATSAIRSQVAIYSPDISARPGLRTSACPTTGRWATRCSNQACRPGKLEPPFGIFAYDHGMNVRMSIGNSQGWASESYSHDVGRGPAATRVIAGVFGAAVDQGRCRAL
jgi:hypothetical protein